MSNAELFLSHQSPLLRGEPMSNRHDINQIDLLDLLDQIERSERDGTGLFFAVESDDIGEVVSAVGRLEYFARENNPGATYIAQVIDAIEEQRDVPRLMATARRDGVVRFVVVPTGSRWWIRHLTGIPEDRVRWAIL